LSDPNCEHDSAQAPLVTIAFVFRERLSPTLASLRHLIGTTSHPHRLICVDSGSPPDLARSLRELASEHGFTLIRSEAQLTPNESRNLALQQVDTKYVVFVDNDVMVGENWLAPLVRCAEETGAWLVGPLYLESSPRWTRIHMFGGEARNRSEDGTPVFVERHDLHKARLEPNLAGLVRRKTGLIEFHTVLMSMEAYRRLGPLDPRLYCHSEHADLSMAVTRSGGTIYVEPVSVVTYMIPDRLGPMDRDYFSRRWCSAWNEATNDRLAEKYEIEPDEQGLVDVEKYVEGHRQKALVRYPRVRRVFGKAAHEKFVHRVGRPLEKRRNMRRYPRADLVDGRRVVSEIVETGPR